MALINCRECGKEVSTAAAACPHCGAPAVAQPEKKPKKSIIGSIILGVVIASGIVMCSTGTDGKNEAKPAAPRCASTDLQCLGETAVVAAGVYCQDPIERMAKHAVRWTDGTFEPKFSRFRWKDQAAGSLTMVGDRAEFQNGFGAYTPVIYECDLGADGVTVLAVRVREGRLPK